MQTFSISSFKNLLDAFGFNDYIIGCIIKVLILKTQKYQIAIEPIQKGAK